jgi:GNAT superfamily N-acetyltransferase
VTLSAPAPLSDDHDLDTFSSGVVSLDDWLKKRARANQAGGASRTYIITDGREVAGYYSLASGSVSALDAPGRVRRNMPDPIPVVILGRLAVGQRFQGNGIGRALVRDAGKRVLSAGELIGIRALLVHAISDEAKTFYEALGFLQSPTQPLTLMIPLQDLRATL